MNHPSFPPNNQGFSISFIKQLKNDCFVGCRLPKFFLGTSKKETTAKIWVSTFFFFFFFPHVIHALSYRGKKAKGFCNYFTIFPLLAQGCRLRSHRAGSRGWSSPLHSDLAGLSPSLHTRRQKKGHTSPLSSACFSAVRAQLLAF